MNKDKDNDEIAFEENSSNCDRCGITYEEHISERHDHAWMPKGLDK